jgi:hypothetical protein
MRNHLVTACLDERAGLGEPADIARIAVPAVTVAAETLEAADFPDQGAG